MLMRCLPLLLFVFSCSTVDSQRSVDEAAIREAFKIRKQWEEKLMFDSLLEYTYPPMFELRPKEYARMKMKQVLENDILQYTIDNLHLDTIMPAIAAEGKFFVPVFMSGSNTLKMQVAHVDSLFAAGQMKVGSDGLYRFLCEDMTHEYGPEVVCDDENKWFTVKKVQRTLFVFETTGRGKWSFLDYSPGELASYRSKNVFPEVVLDKL